jgi:hypothetical protein
VIQALFQEKLHVLNIGLSSFADSITRAGGSVLQIEWAPPAQGQQEVGRALARLVNLLSVETANQIAFDAYQSAQPVLNGVGTAQHRRADDPAQWSSHCVEGYVRTHEGSHRRSYSL